jgi:hypothetical protein
VKVRCGCDEDTSLECNNFDIADYTIRQTCRPLHNVTGYAPGGSASEPVFGQPLNGYGAGCVRQSVGIYSVEDASGLVLEYR